eukprot:CAMPEP_0173198302 /NCGR_PEP_ID=MMETSP1141-20130122/16615_1 /TAXON_ID=483371 /ORGANISM="non described non described, Strain CCMP2298" /LENGTH=160 /DNA_ID=CAMNT_0014123087 /DNA_START=78 /DNA_END=556 /DNA_ORIENTATION=-
MESGDLTKIVRVRFLDEFEVAPAGHAEGFHYLRFLTNDHLIPLIDPALLSNTSSDQLREINARRERAIFVKASLQHIDSFERDSKLSSLIHDTSRDRGFQVIRTGGLWKATRGVGAWKMHWRRKYVQLQHGQFTYTDTDGRSVGMVMGAGAGIGMGVGLA